MKGLFVSLLLTSLAHAVKVYLHPDPSVLPRLSPRQSGAVLSKHLGLERFEDATPHSEDQELMFGQGRDTGMLLIIPEEVTKEVIPPSFKKSFSISSEPTRDSLSALIPTYINRAQHVYSHVYESSSAPSTAALAHLYDFLEGDYAADRFGAFDLTSISELQAADHDQARGAYQALRETLVSVIARSDMKLAIVAVPSSLMGHEQHRRQPPQQSPLPPPLPHPAEPIDSIATCYASVDTCGNATSACSGHGVCVQASKAGKTCFVCACNATKDAKGRKEHWAGNACERKDVSGPFVLLAGTAITLLLLVGGSVVLLSSVGDQTLPSTLTGGVAHGSSR